MYDVKPMLVYSYCGPVTDRECGPVTDRDCGPVTDSDCGSVQLLWSCD